MNLLFQPLYQCRLWTELLTGPGKRITTRVAFDGPEDQK